MRILGFGTYDVRSHPRVQVLLDGLAQSGCTVRELNRPLGIGTAGRVAALKSPKALLTFAFTLLARWASLVMGSLSFRGHRRPDALLVGYLGHFDVLLARLLFPRTTIVLDHLIFAADTAKDRGARSGLLQRVLAALDVAALRAADVIVLDTPQHAQMVPAPLQRKAIVVHVGAPDAWFEARRSADDTDPHQLSVVFFGLFTPLQGAPVIAKALKQAAHQCPLRITMIGGGQDVEQCRQILSDTPVNWVDWVDSSQLPRLVAAHDVCLGIAGTTPKALHVVPNKVYQGMAAGCCVITSDTPPQRQVLGGDALLVPAGNVQALSDALVRVGTDPALLRTMRSRAATSADQAFHPVQVVRGLVQRLRQEIV